MDLEYTKDQIDKLYQRSDILRTDIADLNSVVYNPETAESVRAHMCQMIAELMKQQQQPQTMLFSMLTAVHTTPPSDTMQRRCTPANVAHPSLRQQWQDLFFSWWRQPSSARQLRNQTKIKKCK